jgi:predicted O-linked N-acetylglucosamine transferase (SPINDLY family)
MVPPTYQVSFYDRHLFHPQHEFSHSFAHLSKHALRKFYGLPVDPDAIIFCNFNKVDKIDQISLHAWLGVLQRLPSAFLWLLEPTKVTKEPSINDKNQQISLVKENLIAVATTFGIASGRIIFASRVEKSLHIARHAAADLFLDTFTYGAHSTATDALFGGIPVLTVQGGTFGSRVGASLYASICTELFFCNILVTRGTKQFQDSAVRIGGSKQTTSALKVLLSQAIRKGLGLFLFSRGVDNFLRAMQALKDARLLFGGRKNIITPFFR